MKHKIQILLYCTYILSTFCNADKDVQTTSAVPTGVEVERKQLTDSVNNLGYNIVLKMMEENQNENILISPTGIVGLLAMTLLGSVGRTYDELTTYLGFSQDILTNRKHHEQFGELLQQLNDDETTSKTLYADAMFVDIQTRIRTVFKDYLTAVYHGEARTVNFTEKNEVKQMINDWVKIHTEGKIEDFLKHPLPENTKIVLLCALYFNGQWALPFLPGYTLKIPFTKPNNEDILVDQMLNLGEFDYIFSEKDGLHMLALPYNDSTTVMYALKPRFPNKVNLKTLMSSLDYKKIDELINQMNRKNTVVRIPKMDLESNIALEKTLKALGIKTMFNPTEANFALMIDSSNNKTENEVIVRSRFGEQTGKFNDMLNSLPNPGVYVDSVLHNVKITVNEFGTEAVAATAGVLARSAELFYADSPFYMFIRNEKTKLVTFSAVIYDPTT